MLRDDEGVVGVFHVHQQHFMVAVDEIVYFLRTHHEGGDDLAFVEFLVVARDDTFFHQR